MFKQKFFSLGLAIGLAVTSVLATTPVPSAELEEIEQRGKLIVAVKDNLRPLGFRGEDGNLQGLEIDIARHLAVELLGDPDAVVLQPVTNLDRLKVVLDGTVDLTIARVGFTESRARLVDFSDYYYLDGTGLVTKDASINKLEDVATRKIAVINDSNTVAVVKDTLPNSELVGVDSYQEALTLLEKGAADAFAADKTVLTGWVQEYPQYRLLSARLSGAALCVVIPKGLQHNSLHRKVNEAIARWEAEGWLAERAAAWGLPNE